MAKKEFPGWRALEEDEKVFVGCVLVDIQTPVDGGRMGQYKDPDMGYFVSENSNYLGKSCSDMHGTRQLGQYYWAYAKEGAYGEGAIRTGKVGFRFKPTIGQKPLPLP